MLAPCWGAGLDERSLPTLTILWFCDILWYAGTLYHVVTEGAVLAALSVPKPCYFHFEGKCKNKAEKPFRLQNSVLLSFWEHYGIPAGFMHARINAADSAICFASRQAFPGLHMQFSWYQVRHAVELTARALPFSRGLWDEALSIIFLPGEQTASILLCSGRERKQGSGFFARTIKHIPETFQLHSKSFLRKGNRVVYFTFNYKLSFSFIYFLFVRKKIIKPQPSHRRYKTSYEFNWI